MIPLSKLQRDIMQEFYNVAPTRVIFTKRERKDLWEKAKRKDIFSNLPELQKLCPALVHQIQRSYHDNANIQSAVFSKCVYAQTFANILKLDVFANCYEDISFLQPEIMNLLKSYSLTPRYAYFNQDKTKMLIQAGGCGGIDSALITVMDLNVYTIEFKEPGAKTSEPDLPKYGEDGKIVITDDFISRYPQFEAMLREQKDLNFFEVMGRNVHAFSDESINIAVTNNYVKKYADVVCTEDSDGYLVMLPCNQISQWASIEGEIRPAGRNHYSVWTPQALMRFLRENGAEIVGTTVTIPVATLKKRKARGGGGTVTGYKINPLFFVYKSHCEERGGKVIFDLNNVQQLNPTIAGKAFFKNIHYAKVKEYYFGKNTEGAIL